MHRAGGAVPVVAGSVARVVTLLFTVAAVNMSAPANISNNKCRHHKLDRVKNNHQPSHASRSLAAASGLQSLSRSRRSLESSMGGGLYRSPLASPRSQGCHRSAPSPTPVLLSTSWARSLLSTARCFLRHLEHIKALLSRSRRCAGVCTMAVTRSYLGHILRSISTSRTAAAKSAF